MGTHGFEHGDNIGVALAGHDGAAVDEHTGAIQPRHAHQATGHVLVAAAQGHQAVKPFTGGHGFNGVGNHLAGDQRILHSFGAVGDAIGNSDGVKNHALAAGRISPFAGLVGQLTNVAVAGCDLAPGGRDPHLGFVEILIGKSHRPQHGPAGGFTGAINDLC